MKILITGGAGYIGSHTAIALLDKGYEVVIIDSLITGNKKLIPKKAKFYKCDISDKKKTKQILKKYNFDAVIHFAGLIKVEESFKKPKKYMLFNYEKAKKFLEICIEQNLKNIIFSSTASVYGNLNSIKCSESDSLKARNPYAKSKLKFEKFLINQNKKNNINFIILRYFNVAGADSKLRSGLIGKNSTHLIKVASEVAVKKRKYLILNGSNFKTKDGTPIRDFIHVSDLADIHISSISYILKKQKSDIFNCGYGKGFSVLQIVKGFNKILKTPIEFKYGPRRQGDAERVIANCSKLKRKLRWKPKYNNIEKILRSSLNWEKFISRSYNRGV